MCVYVSVLPIKIQKKVSRKKKYILYLCGLTWTTIYLSCNIFNYKKSKKKKKAETQFNNKHILLNRFNQPWNESLIYTGSLYTGLKQMYYFLCI